MSKISRPCPKCNGTGIIQHAPVTDPNAPWHGSEYGYTRFSCRCAECTEAWRLAAAERKRRRAANLARLESQRAVSR